MSNTNDSQGDGPRSEGRIVHVEPDQSTAPSMAVVEAVADATDCDSTTMPPLGYTVDTDALDSLLDADKPVTTSFAYNGVTVTVEHDGGLVIRVAPTGT